MASSESNEERAQSERVEIFSADETVRSWIRLARQSRSGQKNRVRLQLSIDLDLLAETHGLDREILIGSLVNLVGTVYVDTNLTMTCVEPGSGVTDS